VALVYQHEASNPTGNALHAAAAAAVQVAGRSFMPLQFSSKPDSTKWQKEPVLQTRGSKFIKFQEARIQVGDAAAAATHVLSCCLHFASRD
jgi:hypothetical protein